MEWHTKYFFVNNNQEGNVEVSQNGFDWRAVSKQELANILDTLKQNTENAIIYSRENPLTEATSQAMETFKMIESAKLPIRLVKRKGSDGSEESEPNNELSYANCLLVTLAKAPGVIAVLQSGLGVPDIEGISKNPNELLWIHGLPFNYAQLNADIVIKVLIDISKKRLFNNNRELTARMVLSEGKSEMVRFQIKPPSQKTDFSKLK